MTVPDASQEFAAGLPPEERAQPLYWRHALLALMPLALAGMMPLWGCLLLCLFTLGSLRWPQWAAGRLALFLLAPGLTLLSGLPAAVAAGRPGLTGLALAYVLLLLQVFILHLAVNLAQDGRRRGVALLLIPGLLAPQPWLIPALLGGLLGREGRDDRLERLRRSQPRAWMPVGVLALLLFAFSWTLPQGQWRPQIPQDGPPGQLSQGGPAVTTSPSQFPEREGDREAGTVYSPVAFTVDERRVSLPLEYGMLGGLLLLVSVWMLLRQGVADRLPRSSWIERLMVMGLGLTFVLAVLAAFTLGMGDGALGGQEVPADMGRGGGLGELLRSLQERIQAAREIDITAPLSALNWLALLGLFLLAGAALVIWRNRPQLAVSPAIPDTPEGDGSGSVPLPALHRVRLAYREAEAALREAGYGRGAAETPDGYAQRLSREVPGLQGPLQVLTQAYDPVRYGGRVSDEEADAAEAALRQVLAELSAQGEP